MLWPVVHRLQEVVFGIIDQRERMVSIYAGGNFEQFAPAAPMRQRGPSGGDPQDGVGPFHQHGKKQPRRLSSAGVDGSGLFFDQREYPRRLGRC